MRRRELHGGAMYGDCLPDGDKIVLSGNLYTNSIDRFGFNATHFDSNIGRIELPQQALFEDFPLNKIRRIGSKLLFNRLTNVGGFKIASKSHYSNNIWIYENNSWRQDSRNSYGVQGHAWRPDGFLQVMKDAPNQESQGFRYYDILSPSSTANADIMRESTGFVTGSPTYSPNTLLAQWYGVNYLYGWTRINNIIVGQGENGGCVIQRNNKWKLLEPGEAEFIQFHMWGSILAIAMTFLKARSVVLWWISEDEIDNLPDYNPKLEPKPEPKPEPEPKPGDSVKLTQRHVDIVEALYSKNVILADGDDSDRRFLTQMIDEQICFEFGSRWGMKARNGGSINSASKDSIGYLEDDGTVSVWDWQNGSTRKPQVTAGKEPNYSYLPKSEAIFIPVSPINHLGTEDDTDDDTDDDTNDDADAALQAILESIMDTQRNIMNTQNAILGSQVDILQRLQIIINKPIEVPPIQFPTYSNRFIGKITPEPKK